MSKIVELLTLLNIDPVIDCEYIAISLEVGSDVRVVIDGVRITDLVRLPSADTYEQVAKILGLDLTKKYQSILIEIYDNSISTVTAKILMTDLTLEIRGRRKKVASQSQG